MRKKTIIGVSMFLLGFMILLHQFFSGYGLFDPSQFLHHENLAMVLFALGLGFLLGGLRHDRRNK